MVETAGEDRVYGEVNSKTGLRRVFLAIRREVGGARSRAQLTTLYRRAAYLMTLMQSSAWRAKFGGQLPALRRIGAEEFGRTARKINRRARQLDTPADYDEAWG